MDCIKGADLSSQEVLCGVNVRTADYVSNPWNCVSCLDADGHTRVCIASTCKLVYWNRVRYSDDLTFDIWPVTLCTQMIQCMSIASFCFLYLKPLFEILDSGFIRSDEFRRKGQMNPAGSYNLFTMSSGKESRKDGNILTRLAGTENHDLVFSSVRTLTGLGLGGPMGYIDR